LRPTHPESSRRPVAVELLAVLFFFISLIPFGGLVYWVATTQSVINATSMRFTTWAFVDSLGVVRPLLLVFASAMLIRLSFTLRQGQVAGIRWANLIVTWLIVLTGGFAIYQYVRSTFATVPLREILAVELPLLLIAVVALLRLSARNDGSMRFSGSGLLGVWLATLSLVFFGYQFIRAGMTGAELNDGLAQGLPALLALGAAFGLQRAVVAARPYFLGDEDILSKRTRNAWNLLTPTLIVFILVAITPLERVFITSLTDERFASSAPVTFVGLENYADLWSVRVDIIPCETDEAGACVTEIDRDGNESIVYPRPRRYFPEDSAYVQLRFRDMTSFDIGDRHFVISARDTEFIESFVTSLHYTVLATFFQFTIGFAMAMVLAQRVRGIGLLRLAMLVPMAIPTLIATQFWSVMLRPDETGLVNYMLLRGGLIDQSMDWLLTPELQVPTLVAVIVWRETPIVALLLLPGLLAIPREVYQAAAIDGANKWQRFWYITLPMMRPTIGVALVLRTMIFLRVFDLFEILVGRTRFVMSTYTHDVLIQRQQLGYASAVSVTIFIITMLFTIAYMRTLRIDEA
ncbi:MAG: sugar ABC transporter permease, partial [Chloroflexota bacterium]